MLISCDCGMPMHEMARETEGKDICVDFECDHCKRNLQGILYLPRKNPINEVPDGVDPIDYLEKLSHELYQEYLRSTNGRDNRYWLRLYRATIQRIDEERALVKTKDKAERQQKAWSRDLEERIPPAAFVLDQK